MVNLECKVSYLVCGYNGTGISMMVSMMEQTSPDRESKVFSRCLVNVGDGTQRFCKENRIKLTSISCIIISSLTPHNISGFPGIFLSLSDMGIGTLIVVGPPGLKSYLDLMTPFINRKYPELTVLEIDQNTTKSELLLKIPHMDIGFLPISASQAPTRCIAIAACFTPTFSSSITNIKSISVLPMSYYFDLQQTHSQLVLWSKGGGLVPLESAKPAAPKDLWASSSSSDESDSSDEESDTDDEGGNDDPTQLFIFVPLAVSSHCPLNADGLMDTSNKHVQRLQHMCHQARARGIVVPGGLSTSECEFRFCQRSLSAMTAVCRPLFPAVLTGIQKALISLPVGCVSSSSIGTAKVGSSSSSLSFEEVMTSGSRQLIVAVPLMSVSFGTTLQLAVVRPHGGSCAQTASRCADSLALYISKVLPFLEDIVAGRVHVSDRKVSLDDDAIISSNTTKSKPAMRSNQEVANALRLAIRNKRKLCDEPLQQDTFSSSSCQSAKLEIALSPCWSDTSSAMGSRQSRAPLLNYLEEEEEEEADASLSGTPLSRMSGVTSNAPFSPDRRATEGSQFFAVADQRETTQLESIARNQIMLSGPFKPMLLLAPSLGDIAPVLVVPSLEISPSISLASVPPPSPSDAFVVSFLGTGCATPSKHRNNSCIMVGLTSPADGQKTSLLMDVGEGTAAQIYQSVSGNVARYDAALLSIKVIWISHHHADHITGLPQLLEQIQRAHMRVDSDSSSFAASEQKALRAVHSKYSLTSHLRQGGALYRDSSKIMLIGGESVLKYFEYALSAAGLDDLVTFYPLVNTLYAGATSDVAAATNGHVTQLRSVAVQHCHSSYGIVLNFSTGHKLVYSGDCRPSQSLVKAGMDCDLLIHEATFDDSMAADALKKKHSTASEARGVAAMMRAKHTVLTHFSQRYPIGQSGPQDQQLTAEQVGAKSLQTPNCSMAFDFLRFSFPSQMRSLPQACSQMVSILAALEAERQQLEVVGAQVIC